MDVHCTQAVLLCISCTAPSFVSGFTQKVLHTNTDKEKCTQAKISAYMQRRTHMYVALLLSRNIVTIFCIIESSKKYSTHKQTHFGCRCFLCTAAVVRSYL